MESKMLKVKSYESLNGLSINSGCIEQALGIFGSPCRCRKTRLGKVEYLYENMLLRFDADTTEFIECTILPSCNVEINGMRVTWDKQFLRKVCAIDGAPKIAHGYIILGRLGVAITGIHDNDDSQMAITVFRVLELEEFLDGSKDFSIKVNQ